MNKRLMEEIAQAIDSVLSKCLNNSWDTSVTLAETVIETLIADEVLESDDE